MMQAKQILERGRESFKLRETNRSAQFCRVGPPSAMTQSYYVVVVVYSKALWETVISFYCIFTAGLRVLCTPKVCYFLNSVAYNKLCKQPSGRRPPSLLWHNRTGFRCNLYISELYTTQVGCCKPVIAVTMKVIPQLRLASKLYPFDDPSEQLTRDIVLYTLSALKVRNFIMDQ